MTNTSNIFLIDKDIIYTYDDLLQNINHSESYYPLLKTDCLFDYCSNLLLALISDKPLVLLDSDLNPEEIDEIEESRVNTPVSLIKPYFSSIENVIARLNQSASEITLFTS